MVNVNPDFKKLYRPYAPTQLAHSQLTDVFFEKCLGMALNAVKAPGMGGIGGVPLTEPFVFTAPWTVILTRSRFFCL